MSKKKGTRAERELLHLFWDNGFAVTRTAGSGSITIPSCDLLAGKNGKTLAVECKFIKNSIYIKEERINELREFSEKFGAEPWFGIKVMNKGWFFLPLEKIGKGKGNNYVISYDIAKNKGINFDNLILDIEK